MFNRMSNTKTIEKINLKNIGKHPVVILPLDEYEEMKQELEMLRFAKIAQNISETEHETVDETDILEWAQEAKKQKKSGKLDSIRNMVKKEYPVIAKKYGIA